MPSNVRRQAITATDAPPPTGPFNHAIRAGDFVFTSGQAGRNRDTGQMGDVAEQVDWALRNIANILSAAGTAMSNVVKVTIFFKDGADSKALNDVYQRYFAEPLPARSLVFVSRLKNPEMLVEIEAIACVG